MKYYWEKMSKGAIQKRVFDALGKNRNFYEENVIGIPGSHLDQKVFYSDAPFLQDAPFLTALIHNPNHIGCHTLGKSESFFKGTQAIEKELIALCAEKILEGETGKFDGYVASGGTEANIQALWIYRNYFRKKYSVENHQLGIICSDDSHYSVDKAANLLDIPIYKIPVDVNVRKLKKDALKDKIKELKEKGTGHFIIIVNMMTTMFGSVDSVNDYLEVLKEEDVIFKIHVDGAYGGFFYPFTDAPEKLNFTVPGIDSVTLDAHKMVQAPYGTGIFLTRKGMMQHTNTKQASYIEGEDFTLIGSRSGANAIAVWMILMTYGRFGWEEKVMILLKRTLWLVQQLEHMQVQHYRNHYSNIVALRSEYLNPTIVKKYGLVPDNHKRPRWYKIVVMEHVTIDILLALINDLKLSQNMIMTS
ncbi:MAG: pyridoxal phosphate-dependent decarboxylase family protein [Candidatus Cyclobacteriaceae bacterium M3_2C_046]